MNTRQATSNDEIPTTKASPRADDASRRRQPDSTFGLRPSFVIPLLTLILQASCLIPSAQAQTNFAIPWFKIASGGATTPGTGGVYALSGTIGQVDAGRVAATNTYRIEAGFWAIALQQLGYPSLNITKDAGTNYFVSWITSEPGLILQQAATMSTPTVWIDVSELVSTNALTNTVQQAIATGVTNRFYRLRRP